MAKKRQKRWRSRESYLSKDPEKRARQLANLRPGNHRRTIRQIEAEHLAGRKRPDAYPGEIIRWAEDHFYVEQGKLIRLLDWQREVLQDIFYGAQRPRLAVIGSVKKSGKSALAAIVGEFFLLNVPHCRAYILAPDKEAGEDIVFDSIVTSILHNPLLQKDVKIFKSSIEYRDSILKVLPADLSISGLRPDLTLIDEVWAFRTAGAVRVLDEMTTNPRGEHLTFVTTYAGYVEDQSEDLHLWRWYSRGRRIEQGQEKPDPSFYFRWKTDYADVPWVGDGYLNHQRQVLSPASFRRFHENQWAASESSFVSPELVERCTDAKLVQGRPCEGMVCVGVDVGVQEDATAVAAVGRGSRDKLELFHHRVWRPQQGNPVSLEDVRDWLVQLSFRYRIAVLLYDPSQAFLLAQTLSRRYGINCLAYNQTARVMETASQNLLTLLKSGRLRLYPSEQVRTHLLNAGTKESESGVRIVKGATRAHKIDLAIALALACQGASEYLLRPAVRWRLVEVGTYL